MPRIIRAIAPGFPHHITQRGNYRQKVFYRDEDRRLYLALADEFLPHYGVSLQAFCLMPNHVHLIATPHDQKGLSLALQRIHSDYARSLHLRLRHTGHLWQARFHSTALDEEHFWATMVYVEQNPVWAALAAEAGQWRWSSAQAHLGITESGRLDTVQWRSRFDASTWKQCLAEGLRTTELNDRIRQATLSGFPLGSRAFRQELHEKFGIQTEPAKPGRPRKTADSEPLPLTTHRAIGS